MKKKLGIKNILIILAVFIFFFFFIPILINQSYKYGHGYVTMWSATDVLSYYGSIVGSAATIIALIITIRFTNKANKESHNQQKKLIVAEYKAEQLKKNFELEFEEWRGFRDTILLKMFEQNSINELIFTKPFNQLLENISFYTKLGFKEINNSLSTKEDKEFWAKSLQILYSMLKITENCFKEMKSEETKN